MKTESQVSNPELRIGRSDEMVGEDRRHLGTGSPPPGFPRYPCHPTPPAITLTENFQENFVARALHSGIPVAARTLRGYTARFETSRQSAGTRRVQSV